MENLLNTMIDYIKDIAPDILKALAILIVSFYLAGILARAVSRALYLRKVPEGAIQLISGLTRVGVISIGIILALQSFFDVVTFLSGLGILALTVGFALQDVMKNFASGVILVVQQPFRVNEFVNVSGFDGTIMKLTCANRDQSCGWKGWILPNADILSKPIINYIAARRRVDLLIGLKYDRPACGKLSLRQSGLYRDPSLSRHQRSDSRISAILPLNSTSISGLIPNRRIPARQKMRLYLPLKIP
jgi:small conductance mechanosensitive channel